MFARPYHRSLGAAAAAIALLATTTWSAQAQDVPPPPEDPTDPGDVLEWAAAMIDLIAPDDTPDPLGPTDALNPACDPIDPAMCLFPFPSNRFVTQADTPTGVRVDLPLEAMPRNAEGKPIDPTEWNRNDGFSPGTMLLTHVPELDLVTTWGLGSRAERHQDQITDLGLSLAPDAPFVVVDATTGLRHPFFTELDEHPDTPDDRRTLIIRPAVNFEEGATYVVGMRNLRRADGSVIEPSAAFSALVDGSGVDQARYDDVVFPALQAAGVDRDDLFLAWDFTIASGANLAGRVLHMRDEAFAGLGDTDLANGVVEGDPPAFEVTGYTDSDNPDDDTFRRVEGWVEVPNYLTLPQDAPVALPELGEPIAPGSRLYYPTPTPGPTDLPAVNPAAPTMRLEFVCSIPRTVLGGVPARPSLYGHGLLGGRGESTGSSTERMREDGYQVCAVDWLGMSTIDIPTVGAILVDASNMPSLPDRAQQGFLGFLMLGRALSHPAGFASDPAFQADDGTPLFDPAALVYDGNSQGGIMGGSVIALSPDLTRGVLGVPGINYSTLLNRSVDWEGAYAEIFYAAYPNKMQQQLVFGLIQMLWDRGEGNGFAHHMTDDPYPNTPAHQVLLHPAFGDHQVSNHAAEVMGRTIGARRIATDLAPCRHWALDPMWGFEEVTGAPGESALVYHDSGTPTSPNTNLAPAQGFGDDPHSDPRKDELGQVQKDVFYRTGVVTDPRDGAPWFSYRWPERAGDQLDQVLAQIETCDDGAVS